jgi:hypothetical protein
MGLEIKADPIEPMTQADALAIIQAEQQAAAQFTRDGLEEAKAADQAIFGHVPPYTVTVDGRPNAPLETVNLLRGEVVFEFDLITDVLKWIASTLADRSPVLSGAYKRGHKLLADGREIQLGGVAPKADEFVFANSVPYARKIEIGKTEAGRAFVIEVPNRIYERTAKDAAARFGNIADVQFGYMELLGGYTLRRSVGRRRARAAGASVASPAIIVKYRS